VAGFALSFLSNVAFLINHSAKQQDVIRDHFEGLVNTSLIVDNERRHLRGGFPKKQKTSLDDPSIFSEPAIERLDARAVSPLTTTLHGSESQQMHQQEAEPQQNHQLQEETVQTQQTEQIPVEITAEQIASHHEEPSTHSVASALVTSDQQTEDSDKRPAQANEMPNQNNVMPIEPTGEDKEAASDQNQETPVHQATIEEPKQQTEDGEKRPEQTNDTPNQNNDQPIETTEERKETEAASDQNQETPAQQTTIEEPKQQTEDGEQRSAQTNETPYQNNDKPIETSEERKEAEVASEQNQETPAQQTTIEERKQLEVVSAAVTSDQDQESAKTNEVSTDNNIQKPRFVMHVGPMKTGTTSLQDDVTRLAWRGFLDKDNWHYANRPRTFQDGSFMGHELTKVSWDDPQFIDTFIQEVNKLRPFNRNVFVSMEDYTVKWNDNPSWYKKLKEAVGDQWDVEILCGYRPYFDWYSSFWYQIWHTDLSWLGYLPWKNDNGTWKTIQPQFPNMWYWVSRTGLYVDAVYENASPYFPVKIVNIEDKTKTITQQVLCDVLKADTTCQEFARLKRDDPTWRRVHNKGSLDPMRFDEIGLAAASAGLVNISKFNRTDVMYAIQKHVEEDLHQKATDLPFTCPKESELIEFWDRSNLIETKYVPFLSEANPERETKLRERFRRKLERKTFCRVDTESILQNPEWKSFLEKFS
jgi:hypothetical protein